jgi:hypothetical protein
MNKFYKAWTADETECTTLIIVDEEGRHYPSYWYPDNPLDLAYKIEYYAEDTGSLTPLDKGTEGDTWPRMEQIA